MKIVQTLRKSTVCK